MDNNSCCGITYQNNEDKTKIKISYLSGCMVCGDPLIYHKIDTERQCYNCGKIVLANAECEKGHFICDSCHEMDSIEIIKNECLLSKETDASLLMQKIRSHKIFPLHGPEHHSLIPAVILTVMRNNGVDISDTQIITAINRGQSIPGGACAFNGICGAAAGAGIAMSVLFGADPYDGKKRQSVQKVTASVLNEIASFEAARCCQRDSWIALKTFADILKEKGLTSFEVSKIECCQFKKNYECIKLECPLWMK